MRYLLYCIVGTLCILTVMTGCKSSVEVKSPVSLTWEMGTAKVKPGYYENSFTLKNISDTPLGKDWIIYYSQLPREILQEESSPVRVELVNANFFRMYPAENFKPLAPGDSLIVTFCCTNGLTKISHAPEGTYWVSQIDGKQGTPLPVELTIHPLLFSESESRYPAPDKIYVSNQLLFNIAQLRQTDIFPSVKKVIPGSDEESLVIKEMVGLAFHDDFANEAKLLKEKLVNLYNLEVVADAPVTVHLDYLPKQEVAVNDEYYRMDVKADGIHISASTAHGIFNGTQTLLSLLKGQKAPFTLETVSIQDYPDLPYRGQMLDIARNFTTVENMKKLVDVISSYKLNVLHFHFSDDEGWRLEIPGLEELTSVGARRGHTTDERECLYPGYDGNYDPNANTSGNGYYTREEFIDLLRYAAERHVRVIPEIESPGHARAAIVSMKARYNKYINTDPEKAKEYLLSDAQDTSRYVSAQSYTDNIMNVALPSTYRFMEKVISEVVAMYKEAGVPLATIHLGGDEVPDGAWMGSPVCQAFMNERGMTNAHELSEYYITKMAGYLQKFDLQFSGWQEAALGHPEATDQYLNQRAAGIYCWNTVPEWESDEIPYQIANKGYPVILCNVNNFYMDLAYDAHPDERGLLWAGYVDESKSFSMLPYSIYRSSRTDMAGNPVNLDIAGKGKTTLTALGKERIVGVQAQLFAETIREFQWVEYYIFPKILGLVERGWNTHPAWENLSGEKEQQAFNRDLALFYSKVSDREMPYWASRSINFRLPHPGLCIKEGMLYANTPIRGGEIRYTTDGTEPTLQSALWQAPVACDATTVMAKLFYLNKESVTNTLKKN